MNATTVSEESIRFQKKLERQREEHPERFVRISEEEYIERRAAYAAAHHQPIAAPKNEKRFCGLYQDEIDNLAWDQVRPGVSGGAEAVSVVRSFYGQEHGMVYLGGCSGQAKTLLLKIVVATAVRAGKRACYIDLRDVLQNLKASFQREYHNDEFSSRMQNWISFPVLALDEIDKCYETDWAREQIFYLIDQRYQGAVREQTLTMLAGNQNDKEMSAYIESRLKDNRGRFLILDGPDGRRVMSPGNRY